VAVKPLDDLLAAWAQKPPAWLASGDFREAEVTWASSGAFQVNLLTRRGRRPRKMRFDTHPEGRIVLYSIDDRWIGQRPPGTWENPAFSTYVIPGGVLGGETDLTMRVGPGDFIQPNPDENASLVQVVLDQGSPASGGSALDLFCGVGNFSLPLAIRGMNVLGVDSSEGAIRRAEENAKGNGLSGCEFQAAHVEQAVKKIRNEGKHFDLVLLDPPRSGCKEILEDVAAFGPERIVYVSCNPATLARDLKGLAERGYRLAESRLVDLFPQTYHIESVNLLLRD
jgi:tRNA/tmRNA/rRNA uracil-C5-methylase (TrmA/RlmC/RlmD family)